MSSIDDDGFTEEENDGGGSIFHKWVSLTFVGDRFDIDCARVRCEYSSADYMATGNEDAIVIVPSSFRYVSQMVTHAVLSSRDRSGTGRVEIAVRRRSIRCRRPYRFAYVDGQHYEVMGVSKSFTFHHKDRPCDCGDGSIATDDFGKVLSTTAVSPDHPDVAVKTITLPSDMRFIDTTSQCSTCRIPSNHRLVLEYLKENTNRLSDVQLFINREYMKYVQIYPSYIGNGRRLEEII